MPNGSLQSVLFSSTDSPLDWQRRFSILLDVAQALAFLHLECDPPVIHGDLKPSNVLLTTDFRAKLSDFGLSRLKTDNTGGTDFNFPLSQELVPSQELVQSSPQLDFSPTVQASSNTKDSDFTKRKEATLGETEEVSNSPPNLTATEENGNNGNSQWGKDWWWKQDGSGELDSRDYVAEWIGSQISTDKNPTSDLDEDQKSSNENDKSFFEPGSSSQADEINTLPEEKTPEKKQKKRKLGSCEKKNKKMREWWKEEYFAEINNKSGGHSEKRRLKWLRSISTHNQNRENRDSTNTDNNFDISFKKGWKKKRSRSVSTEMFSGDIFSRELSSTTSMRGTVCYVAPEYGFSNHLMEKTDIYSFGVLILVLLSGRRPLHVLSSPVKLEKANLVSWCRQLAKNGDILELMDEKLDGNFDKDQAALCINLALLCLQRLPELRPDSGEIVKILRGEMELPDLPFEFSPSPRANGFNRSKRKNLGDNE